MELRALVREAWTANPFLEGVPAILTGFFYMFLLFTQMSVANTRWHFVVGWITVLELLVGLHGPAIALINTNNGWPMFLFGFLFLFTVGGVTGIVLSQAPVDRAYPYPRPAPARLPRRTGPSRAADCRRRRGCAAAAGSRPG